MGKTDDYITTESGLRYKVLNEGTGEPPEAGDNVQVHYTGTFESGEKFDSSVERGTPLTFGVGKGMVIKGWDEALLTMKTGEKRICEIPPDLAYGERGYPGAIPPNSTLIFEMELIEIN